MPHINTVTKHMTEYKRVSNMNLQNGSSTLGDMYRRHEQQNTALQWYRRVLTGYEKSLGVDYPHTLTAVNQIALIIQLQRTESTRVVWSGIGWQGEGIGSGPPGHSYYGP